ncbi:MAG: aminotransferase class I/II-fold pyridoxal phosphate-dependent enzyme [Planctomycetes bacterium]|nr:aminotransferase class I/II-fold pyridoxal phosphate-dependent enzyme [Planctomycetota bacterium]
MCPDVAASRGRAYCSSPKLAPSGCRCRKASRSRRFAESGVRAVPLTANRAIRPARRTEGIKYAIRDVIALAEQVAATGREMLYLNIGDPNIFDFAPPAHVLEATFKAMRDNHNGYAPSSGVPEAREAVRREAERKGIRSIQHVYITSGCSEAIDLALSALADAGDNVLTPSPGYPLYTAVLSKLGVENRPYFLDESAGWTPDVEDIAARIDAKTKAIVLINPNNPTGAMYPREALERIIDLTLRNNLVILADEIYDKLVFDGQTHTSLASLSDEARVITFNGLSKAYVVPGFRVGWGIISGPTADVADFCEAIRKMERARLSANHPEQYAIKPALEGPQDHRHEMVQRLQRRRDITTCALNSIPGISCVKPGGAFYAFPRIDLGVPDATFVQRVLRETGVVLVHGSGFGQRPGTEHFRVVFLPPEEALKRAFEHIASVAAALRK